MLPTSQIVFPGSYAPAAPSDMFAGLGKNGQIVSISKRLGLVVVRMAVDIAVHCFGDGFCRELGFIWR